MSTATFPTTPLADTAVLADTAQTTPLADTSLLGEAAAAPAEAANGAQPGRSMHPAGSAQPVGTAPAVANDDSRGLGIASFVLGLVSVVSGWTFFAPLAGLILGIVALRRGTSERTLTIWGIALNGAMLALAALALIVVLSLLSFGIFTLPFLS